MNVRFMYSMLHCGLFLVLSVALWSCSNIQWIYVDRLAPAKVSIPDKVRRIAVVNNQPVMENPHVLNFWMMDTRVLVDSLAQRLADSHYFNEVVVLDSVLTTMSDPISYDRRQLSLPVVNKLSRQLGVDMLVSVEFAGFVLDDEMNYPYYSGTIYSLVKLYIPGQENPYVHTIQEKEEIYDAPGQLLEEWVYTKAISVLYSQIVPHWISVELPYYTGANVDMRDASVYVREGNWEKVLDLWQRQLKHKNHFRRMEANLNMAVWHEVHDDSIGMAKQYAQKAKELLKKKKNRTYLDRRRFISDYIRGMEERGKDLERVKEQMRRFSDDF